MATDEAIVPRGRPPVIRDPAIAVAVGKCWLARTRSAFAVTAHHPEECGFCEMPLDKLIWSLEEFNEWSGVGYRQDRFDPSNPTIRPWRVEIERFDSLPREEQDVMVRRAQGYIPDDDD